MGDAGAPEGNPRHAPPPPTFASEWTLGKPDLLIQLPKPFSIPAGGSDLYQCFVIPAPAGQSHWVRALDIRPGNSKVVHHVILFQDTSHTAKRRDLLQSAERVVLRDHPVIPLYFYVNKHLVKPEVEGWYENVMNVVYSKDLGLR